MRLFCITAFLVYIGMTGRTCQADVIYDAVADFSTANNPNGVWSYHFANDTDRDGAYELFTEVDPLASGPANGSSVWHADASVTTAQRPYAGINTTGDLGGGSWALNELAIHPGRSGGALGDGPAVLMWTSPVTGTVSIDYDFALGLDGSVNWFFEKNGNVEELGTLTGINDSASFSRTSFAVLAGDKLSFGADNNSVVGNDVVRITNAKITSSVPEPSSLMAIVICVPLALFRRSRFNQRALRR